MGTKKVNTGVPEEEAAVVINIEEAATPENAADGTETAPKDPSEGEGGTVAKEPKDSKLDKGKKTKGTDAAGDTAPEEFLKAAKHIFAGHNYGKLYFTSDGQAFTLSRYADAHARTLDDKRVVLIEN